MSSDYYLICPEKKVQMPLFTMNLGGIGLVNKNWVFDFIMECSGQEMFLVHEDNARRPEYDDAKCTFINSWHKHPDEGNNTEGESDASAT